MVDKMTSYDHYMVMTSVRIADLKARLSEFLRQVRRGKTVTVLHRDMAVARIVPVDSSQGPLTVRSPSPGSPGIQKVQLPPRLKIKGDVVELLMEERQADR